MTLSAAVPVAQSTGNGVTKAFPLAQAVLSFDHIIVKKLVISTGAETTVSSADYVISGTPAAAGGYSDITVTFAVAPTTDNRITILRTVPLSQDQNYNLNAHEVVMDKIFMALQQQAYDITRTIRRAVSETGDL